MTNWLITQYPGSLRGGDPRRGHRQLDERLRQRRHSRTKETEFFGDAVGGEGARDMIRQSPLTYADRVKAPTLFINGEVDQRVPLFGGGAVLRRPQEERGTGEDDPVAGQPHGIAGNWNKVHRMLNELGG